MCVNKIPVKDLLRKVTSWYNCNHCAACMSRRANRRASRIRNNHPKSFTCFFVTLTYDNKYIPYCKFHDLESAFNSLQCGISEFDIPVYRSYDVLSKTRGIKMPYRLYEPIDHFYLRSKTDIDEFKKLSGLRTVTDSRTYQYTVDYDKYSIAYSKDFQKFINRFRQRLFRLYERRIPMQYYFAPEYGPTSQRYHIHFLIWLPSTFTEVQVRSHVIACWPYADSKRTSNFCEIARNPARYISQYVNCSSDVSKFLLENFPLRPSHSLGFGFDNPYYDLSTILERFQNSKDFTYPITRSRPDGTSFTDYVLYPTYVIYRYFPKIQGFYRLSRSSLYDIIYYVEFYLSLSENSCGCLPSGELIYLSNVKDIFGNSVSFTKSYSRYFINRVRRSYRYFEDLGISFFDYSRLVVDYLIGRQSSLLKAAAASDKYTDYIQTFYNVSDLLNNRVHRPDLITFIDSSAIGYDCNKFPNEITETLVLESQYLSNIKQRKINLS